MVDKGNKTILMIGLVGLFSWLVWHFGRITNYEHGLVRLILGTFLSLVVIFRWKPLKMIGAEVLLPVYLSCVVGMLFVVGGIIVPIHQFEWLGLIMLFYACLRIGLPSSYSRDILCGTFLMYWIHPLPGQIFSRLQLWMQSSSVYYAEWMLHCFNVRCWADDMILRTGFRSFEVPESCSGMGAAVTVLVTALGVAMLFRFKWYYTLPLLLLGLLQVLALNVLRIFFMVFLTTKLIGGVNVDFLHDTLGLFLFVSVLLIPLEASWWNAVMSRKQRQKKAIETGEGEMPDNATMLPRFWRLLVKRGGLLAIVLLLLGVITGALYKHRPAHRAVMIGDIVEGLSMFDLESAERSVDEAIRLSQHASRHLLSQRALILAKQGDFDEALIAFNSLPGNLSTIEIVFKSSTLMSLNRRDDAMLLLASLPKVAREIPGVAIIRAQYGVMENKPEIVKENVVIAARALALHKRIRAFFPYLAEHGMWRVIVDIDKFNVKYDSFPEALIAVQARLKTNEIGSAGDVMRLALKSWPEEPRFLGSLFSLAMIRPDSGWEDLFADNMTANIATLDADHLADCINNAFRLNRPDLAWLAIMRLKIIDPRDPALPYSVARFGSQWFVFRKHKIGVNAQNNYEKIDLREFYLQSKDLEPFLDFWANVPFVNDITTGNTSATRLKYIDLCMTEIERRKASGNITARIKMMYPSVLSMTGRLPEAQTALSEIADSVPEKRAAALLQKALLFDTRGDWQNSYETLKQYFDCSTVPAINPYLLFLNALLNLNMGSCALDVIQNARCDFSDSVVLDYAEAAVWDTFGFREEALFSLLKHKADGLRPKNMVDLYYATGRVTQAREMASTLSIPPVSDEDLKNKQFFVLPSAELAVTRRWPAPLSEKEMKTRSLKSQKLANDATSPFVKDLFELQANWYAKTGQGLTSNVDVWSSIGRDNMERCIALHRLAVFLARQRRYDEAINVVKVAIKLMPHTLLMRRILILLTQGDTACVQEAMKEFPEDPEIWLAYIVQQASSRENNDALLKIIEDSAENRQFSPGIMVRAGDFLLKKGFLEAAEIAAKYAIEQGNGFMPAYALGLACAAKIRDRKWALSCAVGAAANAVDPEPFFRILLQIQSKSSNKDILTALEYLHKHSPENREWVQHLAHIYFYKGDVHRAIGLLTPVIDKDAGSMRVQSLLLAAEAARQEGQQERAINLLKLAYTMSPDRLDVLNNLVYNLAQNQTTLNAACEYLPKLLALDNHSASVMDTVAVVYMKSGRLSLAWRYAEKALRLVRKDDYSASEISINAAEIMYRMGNCYDAERQVKNVFRCSTRSRVVDMRAKKLSAKIKSAKSKTD